jgi:hypothetical protein
MSRDIKPNLFLKYRSINKLDSSDVDLATLGESILGFDIAIKEIIRISKINGDVRLSICGTREGSLIADIAIQCTQQVDVLPFDRVEDLLNFLKLVDHELWLQAEAFFNTAVDVIKSNHRTINDYFAKNPVDQGMLTFLLGWFVSKLFEKAVGQKSFADARDLPKPYAEGLHRMIKEGKFKKAIKPLVEENLSSLEISADDSFNKKVVVDNSNFDNYLSEEEKILPQYENGQKYRFTGKVVAMQCSVGDSLKVQIHGAKKRDRELVAYPPEDKTTKDLDEFYEEDVIITALIKRDSLYHKPKLYIQDISLYQQPLI